MSSSFNRQLGSSDDFPTQNIRFNAKRKNTMYTIRSNPHQTRKNHFVPNNRQNFGMSVPLPLNQRHIGLNQPIHSNMYNQNGFHDAMRMQRQLHSCVSSGMLSSPSKRYVSHLSDSNGTDHLTHSSNSSNTKETHRQRRARTHAARSKPYRHTVEPSTTHTKAPPRKTNIFVTRHPHIRKYWYDFHRSVKSSSTSSPQLPREARQYLLTYIESQLMHAARFENKTSFRIVAFSVLGMIVIFFIAFSKEIKQYFAGQTSEVAGTVLTQEDLQMKASDFAKIILHQVLTDSTVFDQANLFVQSLVGARETHDQLVELVSSTLQAQETRRQLYALLADPATLEHVKRLLTQLVMDPSIQQTLLELVLWLLSRESTKGSLQSLLASLFQDKYMQEQGADYLMKGLHILLDDAAVKQHTTAFVQEVLADAQLQKRAGDAIWNAAIYSISPSFLYRKKEPNRDSTKDVGTNDELNDKESSSISSTSNVDVEPVDANSVNTLHNNQSVSVKNDPTICKDDNNCPSVSVKSDGTHTTNCPSLATKNGLIQDISIQTADDSTQDIHYASIPTKIDLTKNTDNRHHYQVLPETNDRADKDF